MEQPASATAPLRRHFGLLQATALNVTMIVGAGVFITIPLMLKELPGPYALLGWLAAGALMLVDGMIWSELGAALPGSGGSYLYLLECYGRERWGRLMAFLFIWQFLISGPLEVASGLIAMSQFADALSSEYQAFNAAHTASIALGAWQDTHLTISVGPSRLAAFGIGVFILFLLYRRIDNLGKLTVTFWIGILGAIAWILFEGFTRFQSDIAFEAPRPEDWEAKSFWRGLGSTMILAMYSYLGYYNVCYIGDEVRDPGRTIPRSILLSSVLVCTLFVGLHLAMLGTVSWRTQADNLPAHFMQAIHGAWAAKLVTVLLIWSCVGSAFAALLGYSRIPYGAARLGHFFLGFGRVHPVHGIPHVALFAVGGLTLLWSFFNFQSVIDALITTRILEQFIGQIIGVMLLRHNQPKLYRPYKIWLYPLPCGLALAGWLYMYFSAGLPFVLLGMGTLAMGTGVFMTWARLSRKWPFA